MATTKTVNYTADQESAMLAAYTANPTKETVNALALEMGKTTRSVIAKLSRLGCYRKPEYVRKDGAKAEKKDETATAIGLILNLSGADTDSLAKANRKALQAVFAALANSEPV